MGKQKTTLKRHERTANSPKKNINLTKMTLDGSKIKLRIARKVSAKQGNLLSPVLFDIIVEYEYSEIAKNNEKNIWTKSVRRSIRIRIV